MNHMTEHYKAIATCAILCLLVACNSKHQYPPELVMADSAYMQGNYQLGDALMEAFEGKAETQGESVKQYQKLLTLERAYFHNEISVDYYATADELCRFFQDTQDKNHYGKALFFTGAIYHGEGDYPTATECFLKAKDLATETKDARLLCQIGRTQGDLYFEQRMLDEMIPCYRQYYQLATALNDTLRMAYASGCMASIHTVLNDVDSTVFFYQKAIELGKNLPQKEEVTGVNTSNLCDIYIQTGQYEKALEIMPRDELNDGNWAYWHLEQNHVDSAIYYFQKTLGRYKWQGEVEVLRLLAELECGKGDMNASIEYYRRLTEAEDSLKEQQNHEETKRIDAQFNYNKIKAQRDELEKQSHKQRSLITTLIITLLALFTVALQAWRWQFQKQKTSQAKQALLERELAEQAEQSRKQMDENEHKLDKLRQQLLAAQERSDAQKQEQLKREVDVLTSQNQNIEAVQRLKESRMAELRSQPFYARLKSSDPSTEKRLSDQEWQLLSQGIDDVYDHFSKRLLSLARLSETELRICYLLKINMSPAEIAEIMFKSKAAITLARQRMYAKLTNRRGKAEDLDDLIGRF